MRLRAQCLPWGFVVVLGSLYPPRGAQEPGHRHEHVMPEKLGTGRFRVTCRGEVRTDFQRGVALLTPAHAHSPALTGEDPSRRLYQLLV